MMGRMRRRLLCLGLAAGLVLSACGDGEDTVSAPTTPDPVVATATEAPAPDSSPSTDTADATSTPTASDTSDSTAGTADTEGATGTAEETAAPSTQEATAAPSTQEETEGPSEEPATTLEDGPVNVLLIGTDARDPSSMSGQADTIMLLHLPADRDRAALISFTRDMWVDIPGLGSGKINSAFARGGTDTLAATVSGMLGGVDIDHTVQANFQGFINLTRWLEGIEVDNQYATTVTVGSTGRQIAFTEGPLRLENTDALIYARQRMGLPLGDLDRTERQRAVMIGIIDRMQERLEDDPAAFPELVRNLHGNVRVTGGLDAADMIGLVPLMAELDPEDTLSLMVPVTGFGTVEGASVNLVDEARTAALGEALREDDLDGYVQQYGTGYAPGGGRR